MARDRCQPVTVCATSGLIARLCDPLVTQASGSREVSGLRCRRVSGAGACAIEPLKLEPLAFRLRGASGLTVGARQREMQDRASPGDSAMPARSCSIAPLTSSSSSSACPSACRAGHAVGFDRDRLLGPRLGRRPIRSLEVLERDLQHRRHMRGRSLQFLLELLDRAIGLGVQAGQPRTRSARSACQDT